jgi:hypothetical protein
MTNHYGNFWPTGQILPPLTPNGILQSQVAQSCHTDFSPLVAIRYTDQQDRAKRQRPTDSNFSPRWHGDCLLRTRWDVKGISSDSSPTREVSGIYGGVIALPLISLPVNA